MTCARCGGRLVECPAGPRRRAARRLPPRLRGEQRDPRGRRRPERRRHGAVVDRRLARYDQLIASKYCRPYCDACLESCVAQLPINDVLRYKMYFEDYGAEKAGIEKYARLAGADAANCLGCPAPCAGACPYDIPIQRKMLEAHAKLRVV